MLRLLQLVFYAKQPLSATELRYALAFGCKAYSSYEEWSQSSEYVRSDEQMEKRVREHSKGLAEVAQIPRVGRSVVQFVHQSVIDFLAADGFSFLRDSKERTHGADGHEFFKNACLNYLSVKDFEAMSTVELRVNNQFTYPINGPQLEDAHPFLVYMVQYLFPHAAQAEQHGIAQDYFRARICSDREFFERWRCLHDAVADDNEERIQGPKTRPLHVFAQYGLLTRDIAEKEKNIDIAGGLYGSALVAACYGGHQDAVKILLDYGADPKFDAEEFDHSEWLEPMAPLSSAIETLDLPVLRLLFSNRRCILTLQERLQLSTLIAEVDSHKDHFEAVLALLFPEVAFPDSAIDALEKVEDLKFSHEVFSFLLDKFDGSVLHEERLWRLVFSSAIADTDNTTLMNQIVALLDRGGRVRITGALVKCLPRDRGAGEVFSLLLGHCAVEVTGDLLDSICAFSDSAQIVRTFRARGVVGDDFDSFTSQQLLLALNFGSAETAAFFLQRQAGSTTTDEMLKSAMKNYRHAKEVTLLLLGHLDPDCIDEQAIITALEHPAQGGDLTRLFHDRRDSLPFSEAALKVAVRRQTLDVVKLILEGLKGFRLTEQILTAATANNRYKGDEIIELLLHHDPDIRIQEPTVRAAIRNNDYGLEILQTLCEHEKYLRCTEFMVLSTASVKHGPVALDIILEHDHNARISPSMVMSAMEAVRGAALISVMLRHDHNIIIDEEHLIAAASNPYDSRTIFAVLQMEGKLGNTNPSYIMNSGPAKRRRISPRSLSHITRKVIDEAFSNNMDDENLPLLELFLEWGLITQAELDNRSIL